jgi:hypothetical protein
MKRGHYVIVGGAALFVIGIAVVVAWALPLAAQIIQETSTLQGEELAAGESRAVSLDVTDTSRPLSVIVNSANKDVELAVVLVTPENQRAIESTFRENTVMSADPTVAGTYELTVTNNGESPTSVDIVFGRLPGVEENNQVDVNIYGGIVAGIGMVAAGVIVMIAGVVVVVIDRRKKPLPTG